MSNWPFLSCAKVLGTLYRRRLCVCSIRVPVLIWIFARVSIYKTGIALYGFCLCTPHYAFRFLCGVGFLHFFTPLQLSLLSQCEKKKVSPLLSSPTPAQRPRTLRTPWAVSASPLSVWLYFVQAC